MPTLLVTGGCGFIGSNFIRHILATDPGVSVINFDALTYAGNLANLSDLHDHKRYQFVRGDVTDRDAVRAAMGIGVTDVIHFAAESHVDRSIQDSGPFVRTNVIGTQNLLDAAREFKVAKYVQVSTDEVYGSLGPTGAFTEETPLHPNSPYSASKAAVHMFTQSMASDYAAENIRVNSIAPGYIATDMTQVHFDGDEWGPTWKSMTPMGRMGSVDEVATAALFLCTPASSYVTGSELHINGGQHV